MRWGKKPDVLTGRGGGTKSSVWTDWHLLLCNRIIIINYNHSFIPSLQFTGNLSKKSEKRKAKNNINPITHKKH